MATHSDYLGKVFTPESFRTIVEMVYNDLKAKEDRFDAIAFRGLSGSLIVPPVAYMLKKGMLAVRKEPAHSIMKVEGCDCTNFIIVDDFIGNGTTVRTILEEVKRSGIAGKPIAVYMWKRKFVPEEHKWNMNNELKGCKDLEFWGPSQEQPRI